MTISDGPEGVDVVVVITSDEDDADAVEEDNPTMPEGTTPAEEGATGNGDGSGEAIGEEEVSMEEEGRGVDSRRLRMRNFV